MAGDLRRRRLVSLAAQGRPEEADRLLATFASGGEPVGRALLEHAIDAHVTAGAPSARERFEEARRSGSTDLEAYIAGAAAGYAELGRGEGIEVLSALVTATRIDVGPDLQRSLSIARISAAASAGELHAVEQEWRSLRRLGRADGAMARHVVDAYLRNGLHDNAIAFVRREVEAVTISREDAAPLFTRIALRLVDRGDLTEAEVLLAELDEQGFPPDPSVAAELRAAPLRQGPSAYDAPDPLQLLGLILGMAVHEIAQPLTALDTATHLIVRRIDEGRIEEARTVIEERLRPAVATLRERFATYKAIADARTRRTGTSPGTIGELLHHLEDMIASSLAATNTELRVTCAEETLGLRIEADPFVLAFALRQLAGNGIDAMVGGQRAPTLEIDIAADGDQRSGDGTAVAFSISDNGTGIPVKQQQHIFRHGYTTKGGGGMGLGMGLARAVADFYEAELHLDTGPSGTSWTVRIPLPNDSGEDFTRKETI